MKKSVKRYLAPFFLALVLMLTTVTPAFAATLDGKDSFTTEKIYLSLDGGKEFALTANETRGTNYVPYLDFNEAAEKLNYNGQFYVANQWYQNPVDGLWTYLKQDTYIVDSAKSWSSDGGNLRANVRNRDLSYKSAYVWCIRENLAAYLNVYTPPTGRGFLFSVYDSASIFRKLASVNLVNDVYQLASVGGSIVRSRFDVNVSVDGTDWRALRANKFQNDTATYVEACETARFHGFAIEFRKAGQWYTDQSNGNSVWLVNDTYIFLSKTGWDNSRANMRTDVRDQATLTQRQVRVWLPYENIWAWVSVKELNNTKDGGGFMFDISTLASFFPGISKVEQAPDYPSYFYITTKATTPPSSSLPPADVQPPIIGGDPGYVDPNDVHGPKPSPVTDFIPKNH